jgi:hypothetical protein
VRRFTVPAALCAVVLQTGCITLFSKTDVVRTDEPRRAVRFECEESAEKFHTACKGHGRDAGGSYVGVPFVTVFSRTRRLSEVAVWNDAVSKCDTDQDGTITLAEATLYSKWPND